MNYKLYKFGAPWCGQCKVLSDRLKAASLDNCEITEFDVDEVEEEMINKFQIRNIPATFLVDENENVIHKWIGVFDVNEISKEIANIEKQET